MLRLAIQGNRVPVFSAFDNISINLQPFPLFLTLSYLASRHMSLLLFPWPLGVDWSGYALPPVTSIYDARNILTLAVFTVIFSLGLFGFCMHLGYFCKGSPATEDDNHPCCDPRKSQPLLSPGLSVLFALGFVLCAFLPSSGLLFSVGFTLAERIMYTPALGAALLGTVVFKIIARVVCLRYAHGGVSERIQSDAMKATRLAACAWVVYWFFLCLNASGVWGGGDKALWMSMVDLAPNSAKGWHSLGVLSVKSGDTASALQHYRRAQRVFEDSINSSSHPSLAPWDMVYPDPYVNEAQLLMSLAPSSGEGRRMAQVEATALYTRILNKLSFSAILPTVLRDDGVPPPYPNKSKTSPSPFLHLLVSHCDPILEDGEEESQASWAHLPTACAQSGSGVLIPPAYLRVHERLVLLAASSFNAAVLGSVSSPPPLVLTPQLSPAAASAFLTASAFLSRADPDLVPISLALNWAARAEMWGLHSLSVRWYERFVRWHLRKLLRAAESIHAPLPRQLLSLKIGEYPPMLGKSATAVGEGRGGEGSHYSSLNNGSSRDPKAFLAQRDAGISRALKEIDSILDSYHHLVAGVKSEMVGWRRPSESPSNDFSGVQSGLTSQPPPPTSPTSAVKAKHAVEEIRKVNFTLAELHASGQKLTAIPPLDSITIPAPIHAALSSLLHVRRVATLTPPHSRKRDLEEESTEMFCIDFSRGGIETRAAPPLSHPFVCTTPADAGTPCGAILVALSRAAEAAVNVFRHSYGKQHGGEAVCTCGPSSPSVFRPLAGQTRVRLCGIPSVVLPFSSTQATSRSGMTALNAFRFPDFVNHSCSPLQCTRWPRDTLREPSEGTPLTLADFGPVDLEWLTLPQVLYTARRAESLSVAWDNSKNSSSVDALLSLCGC